MSAKPRLRSVNQAVKFFREKDPDTSISRGLIMAAINSGKVDTLKSGNRTYLLLDDIWEYFYHEPLSAEDIKDE